MKNILTILLLTITTLISAQTTNDSLLIIEINELRANPKSYIPLVEDYIMYQERNLERIKSGNLTIKSTSGTISKSNTMSNKKIMTNEDVANRNIEAAEELIIVLNNMDSLSPLEYNVEMDSITDSHGKYLETINKHGHYGPNGKGVGERFNELNYTHVSENIGSLNNFSYRLKVFKPMILGMLIDAGVENRGHRNNLLNKDSKYVSVYVSKFVIVQNFTY